MGLMSVQCCTIVADGGPTLHRHRPIFRVSWPEMRLVPLSPEGAVLELSLRTAFKNSICRQEDKGGYPP